MAAAAILLLSVVIVALGITSTRWFCSEGCHKVQDDTIAAYRRSPHSEVSCMACHMPVGTSPVSFVMHKTEALGELYLTVSGRYELPLNAEGELSQDEEAMSSEQCTQCHSPNRPVTPSAGVFIDHEAHEEAGVRCAQCHNRIAHTEDGLKLRLAGNRQHEDFMSMEGCARCHRLDNEAKAPGKCAVCHPKSFELKPDNHLDAGFYDRGGRRDGHAKMAKADSEYCSMCHETAAFCDPCHGMAMPHPAEFEKNHAAQGRRQLTTCWRCHDEGVKPDEFCNLCHHPGASPKKSWIAQHFLKVQAEGTESCMGCHTPSYCAKCHVRSISHVD